MFLISMVFREAVRGFYSEAMFSKYMIIIQFFGIFVKKDICVGIVKTWARKIKILARASRFSIQILT
jgi:hypothetical protein